MSTLKSNQKNVTLSIDFQEGFVNDTVAIEINGKEVLHKEHIITNKLLGFPSSFKTEVVHGIVNVEVKILNRNIGKKNLHRCLNTSIHWNFASE